MVEGCGELIGDHGYLIKDRLARDSNLGCRSGRRSTQWSGVEWSAEPGAEAAQIRRTRESCGLRGYSWWPIDRSRSEIAKMLVVTPLHFGLAAEKPKN